MTKQLVSESTAENGEVLTRGHRKKARTRQQLLEAALKIYARKGAGEIALNELAAEAGVSSGTVYNYFRTREELLESVGIALAEQFSHHIVALSTGVVSGAERMSIAVRMFILKAQEDTEWASALINVIHYVEAMRSELAAYQRADLQAGLRAGDFDYVDEEVAMTMVVSTAVGAITAIVDGRPIAHHDSVIAEMILRALGVSKEKAKITARLPMPQPKELNEPEPAKPRRVRGVKTQRA